MGASDAGGGGGGGGGGSGGRPDRQRLEGLVNSGPNLVNQLASLGQASSYAVTPAAATKQKPTQTPFHMVCKDTTGRFQSLSDLPLRCAFKFTPG